MNLTELLNFLKVAKVDYDAIVTVAEDEAFRAKLFQAIDAVSALLGSGVVKYLISYFSAQLKNLQDQITKLTAKKVAK